MLLMKKAGLIKTKRRTLVENAFCITLVTSLIIHDLVTYNTSSGRSVGPSVVVSSWVVIVKMRQWRQTAVTTGVDGGAHVTFLGDTTSRYYKASWIRRSERKPLEEGSGTSLGRTWFLPDRFSIRENRSAACQANRSTGHAARS